MGSRKRTQQRIAEIRREILVRCPLGLVAPKKKLGIGFPGKLTVASRPRTPPARRC